MDEVPKHIAIIPDGNRRWAKQNGKPALEGHRVGIDNLRKVSEYCRDFGVKTVTYWGFSIENFQRDKAEVQGLLRLFEIKFDEFKNHPELRENQIRVRFFGRLNLLTPKLREKIREVEKETEAYSNYSMNILLAYGGKSEIVDACNAAIADAKAGKIKSVDEESFGKYFYMHGLPEPDLVIRTSGEMRMSGILPWGSMYSEYYFSPKLWPEFSREDLAAAVAEFASRKRRFGK